MKLVSGHERLASWHHFGNIVVWPKLQNVMKPERSRELYACFLEEDSGTILRADVCHIISPYCGFTTQLRTRRHFTFICVLKLHVYGVYRGDDGWRSFIAREERNCVVACIFTMRTCEKKKPPPSLSLRALAEFIVSPWLRFGWPT